MRILRNLLFVLSLICIISCDEVKEYPWNPEWDKYEPETPEEPEAPEEPETPEEPESPEPDMSKAKARLVWVDAAANFNDYANSEAKIKADMQKIKETGFSGVIVDVRPTNTGVLFESSTEHALTKVDAWVGSSYKWLTRTS